MSTKAKKASEKLDEKCIHDHLLTTARRVLMAGIGAVSLAQDEIDDFVNKLVERGEIAEKDGRQLIHDIMDKRKKDTEKVESEIGKHVEEILERMNVPTKRDIESLGEKIASLSKKVDELKHT